MDPVPSAGGGNRGCRMIGRATRVMRRAVARLRRTRTPSPSERLLREQGRAALREGNVEQAEQILQTAVEECGGRDHQTWVWWARSLARGGRLEEAHQALRAAQERFPARPRLFVEMASLQEDDREQARRSLLAALELDPGEGLRLRIARTYLELGDYDSAAELAADLLTSSELASTRLERAAAIRAEALWQSGHREQAAEIVGHMDSPAQERVQAELWLLGDQPLQAWEALAPLSDAELPIALLKMAARRLRRGGHLQTALIALQRGSSIAPGDRVVRRLLSEVEGELKVLEGAWSASSVERSVEPARDTVLHLVAQSLPQVQAGYTIRTQQTVQAQRGAGLVPHVLTRLDFPWSVGARNVPAVEEVDGIPHHRISSPEGRLPLDQTLSQTFEQGCEIVSEVRPAVLHAASPFQNALVALELREVFDVPVVYEVRGFWEDAWLSARENEGAVESERYRHGRDRDLECMSRADAVVTLSEVMRDEIVERGVDAERVTIVPNAVDPAAFPPVARDERLAGQLGIGPDDVTLGSISTFWGYEGMDYLVEATARLVERGLPVKCLLVGDGRQRPDLERRVDVLGLGDRVTITGQVPHGDVLRYYGMIDVFVVPRTNDRICQLVTPLKPYEAMATERVLVVARTRALASLVDEGVTGHTFTPEDGDDLARVLEEILLDAEHRRALGVAAREWVCDGHTWAANAARYRELYRSLQARSA